MKTLKKVAALTLALATLFSISAFALDFKDNDSINPDLVPDIELLNALEIMIGDNKDNFNPDKNITRAEAAKMMYVLKLKRDDGATGWKGTQSPYNDTKGHWAEGYIAYCTSVGIVQGVGKGNYKPEGSITGTELAKMVLVAAGYESDKAGFTGTAWQTNVLKVASEVNLFDSYELSYTAPATRQYAAKLFTNMLNTIPMVKYSKDSESFVSSYNDDRTYGQQAFGLMVFEDVATSNFTVNLGVGTMDSKTSTVGGKTIKTNVPTELLGQNVKVIYKDSNKNSAIDTTETVYGVYPSAKSTVYTVGQDAVTVNGTTVKFAGYNGGNTKDYAGKSIDLYTNGGAKKVAVAVADFATKLFFKSNDMIKLVDNDNDGFINSAFITKPIYAIVNTYDSAKTILTLKDATNALNLKDAQDKNIIFNNTAVGRENWKSLNFADTIATGDVVVITDSIDSGKLVYTVKKMVPTQGKLTSINSDGSVKIGDASYDISASKMTGAALPTAASLGKNYNVYTDGKYAIYAVLDSGNTQTGSELTGNLAYVVDAKADVPAGVDEWGAPKKVNKVDVLKADGSRAIYEYSIPKGITAEVFATALKDKVVEYVMTDGKIYFKTDITIPSSGDYKKVTDELNHFVKATNTFGKYMTNADSYFFVKSVKSATCTDSNANAAHKANCDNSAHDGYTATHDYAVLKASELKGNVTNTGTPTLVYKSVNGLPTLVVGTIVTNASMPNAASSTDYVFVTGKYETVLEGDDIVVTVPAQNSKGETVTLKMASGSTPTAYKLYKVTTDTKGFSTLVASDFTSGTVTGYGNNLVAFSQVSGKFFNVTNDTKIWYVDASGANPVLTTGEGIPLATYVDTDGNGTMNDAEALMENALYKLNSDSSAVTDIFVEVNGATITAIK